MLELFEQVQSALLSARRACRSVGSFMAAHECMNLEARDAPPFGVHRHTHPSN